MNKSVEPIFIWTGYLLSLLIYLNLLLLGCSHPSEKTQRSEKENKILDAKRLIDQNDDERAIRILEEMKTADPGDHDVLVTLASAYAHRGQFKIQKMIGIVSEIVRNSQKLERDGEKGNDKENESIPMARLARQLNAFLNVYEKIPLVEVSQNEDLETALLLLHQIPPHLMESADYLFRGAIRLFTFKFQMGSPIQESGEWSQDSCRTGQEKLKQRLMLAGQSLVLVLDDFISAAPKEAETLNESRSRIKESLLKMRDSGALNKWGVESMALYLQFDNSEYARALSKCEPEKKP